MPWFRITDDFHEDPDLDMLSCNAVTLFVTCGSFCAKHLTDGLISAARMKRFPGYSDDVLAELMDPDLGDDPDRSQAWIICGEGGYQIRNYLNYNPTREKVLKDRERTAERVQKYRLKGNAVTNPSTNPRSKRKRETARETVESHIPNSRDNSPQPPSKRNGVTSTATVFDYLPESHHSAQVREWWDKFIQARKERRKKALTPTGLKAKADLLSKYSVEIAAEMVKKSVENEWDGIFPLNESKNSGGGQLLDFQRVVAVIDELRPKEGTIVDWLCDAFDRFLTANLAKVPPAFFASDDEGLRKNAAGIILMYGNSLSSLECTEVDISNAVNFWIENERYFPFLESFRGLVKRTVADRKFAESTAERKADAEANPVVETEEGKAAARQAVKDLLKKWKGEHPGASEVVTHIAESEGEEKLEAEDYFGVRAMAEDAA